MTIIKSHTELPNSFISRLDENPFLPELRRIENSLSQYKSDKEYYQQDIKTLKQKILNNQATVAYYETKARQLAKHRTAIDNQVKNYKSDIDLTFIDNIEKLVNQTGNRFISASFVDADTASVKVNIKYVRPPKKIGSLPQQPFIVHISYFLKESILQFSNARIYRAYNGFNTSYVHPHISQDGQVCLGNFMDILMENNISAGLTNVDDHIILLDNLLCTYNPDSPYIGLEKLIRGLTSGFSYSDMNVTIEHGKTILSAEMLKRAENGEFARYDYRSVPQIIGKELYEQWVQMLQNSDITVASIAIDKAFELRNNANTFGDDSIENYEDCEITFNYLKEFFKGVKFTHVDDYVCQDENDDGDSYSYIPEEDAQTLFETWADQLEEAVSRSELKQPIEIKLPKIEELNFQF